MGSGSKGIPGVCHIDHHWSWSIKLCIYCGHWICDDHRYSKERIKAAWESMRYGNAEGCCGPSIARWANLRREING